MKFIRAGANIPTNIDIGINKTHLIINIKLTKQFSLYLKNKVFFF
tara:strand:+ start:54 stop:188 length:135 start_codon:yes stop_codon:yes gene_type:complete